MICKNCKNEIAEQSNFCSHCGTKIDYKNNNRSASHGMKINPYIILSIAVIAAVIIVVMILNSNEVSTNSVESTVNEQMENEKLNEVFADIKEIKDELNEDPDNVQLNIQLANNLFDTKQFREAITHYKKALEFEPLNVEVHIDLAVSYFNLQVVDTALTEMEAALKINPHHPQGLFNIGVIQLGLGNKEKARESWNKVIQFHQGTEIAETAKKLISNL